MKLQARELHKRASPSTHAERQVLKQGLGPHPC